MDNRVPRRCRERCHAFRSGGKALTQLRILAALLLLGAPARAQEAATVPASSGLYDRLEALSAWYPLRGVTLGERNVTRAHAARIIERFAGVLDTVAASPRRDWARREVEALRHVLAERRHTTRGRYGTAAIRWNGEFYSSHVPEVRIEPNGLAVLDAVQRPFTEGRHGWSTVQGSIATLAATVAGSTRHLAAVVQPMASLTSIHEGGWTSDRLLHRASVRASYANVAVRVGAEEMRWGQSPAHALFISGNAQPVPALALGSDTAFVLPWWFRLAGPVSVSALLGDLGGSYDPPHARLAGWQVTIQPWTRFELGVAVLAQTGGDGGPKATFLQRLVDLLPVIDALAPQPADIQISNKLAGGNLRLRFPELSGLDLYYELQIDDFDGRRLRSSLVEDAGHLLGMRLPMILDGNQLVWRAEWQHTSLRQYEHTQFPSGTTYRQRLIGNPLGPHAAAGMVSASWQWSPLRALTVAAADERRDPSQYTVSITGDRDRGWTFVRLTDDPDYRRRFVMATLEHELSQGAVGLMAGYNRAWRTGQAGRGDWVGRITISSRRLAAF